MSDDLLAAYATASKLADAAQADVDFSAAAIGAAKVAAIHAGVIIDPLDRLNAEDALRVELSRLERIDGALRERLTMRRADAHRASAETKRPALNEAIARRLIACEKADAAAKVSEQAKIEFVAATRQVQAGYAAGIPRPFDGSLLERMHDAATERALWADVA